MSGGGNSNDTGQNVVKGPPEAFETIGSGQSVFQSLMANELLRRGTTDPRVLAATQDKRIVELQQQYENARTQYDVNVRQAGIAPQDQTYANIEAYRSKMDALRQQIIDAEASKASVLETSGLYQKGQDVASQFLDRLGTGLTTGNFVDPAEEAAMRTAMSGISQDVATTRGLNRSDVPVMQAIAPTLASMWLGQQNTNKAFYTGAYQANQGLGLQANQGLMSVNNPGLGLSSVYSGLRSSNMTGTENLQKRPGGLDYFTGIAGGLKGLGQAAAGGKEAGFF